MCSDGDFAIASGDDKHQASSAKATNPKTSHYVFGEIFPFFLFFSLYVFTHYHWILQL
jgi:hypothetical protein